MTTGDIKDQGLNTEALIWAELQGSNDTSV